MMKRNYYVKDKLNMSMVTNIIDVIPKEVVVLSESVYNSYLGRYYLGQTEMIFFGESYNAWGALVNPEGSNVNMFLNAYTISNFSNKPFAAEGWLNSTLPGEPIKSSYFAAGNQAFYPPRQPKVEIMSASNVTNKSPTSGVYTFTRRVEPNQTLTKQDFQGLYIIPPGSSFALFFLSDGKEQIKARMAFGWWEEQVNFDSMQ